MHPDPALCVGPCIPVGAHGGIVLACERCRDAVLRCLTGGFHADTFKPFQCPGGL